MLPCFINLFFIVSSVNFKGAAWRYEEDQPELAGLKWQDCPAAESGTEKIHTHTHSLD